MIRVNIGDALVSGTYRVTIPIGDEHGLYDLRNLKIVFPATGNPYLHSESPAEKEAKMKQYEAESIAREANRLEQRRKEFQEFRDDPKNVKVDELHEKIASSLAQRKDVIKNHKIHREEEEDEKPIFIDETGETYQLCVWCNERMELGDDYDCLGSQYCSIGEVCNKCRCEGKFIYCHQCMRDRVESPQVLERS